VEAPFGKSVPRFHFSSCVITFSGFSKQNYGKEENRRKVIAVEFFSEVVENRIISNFVVFVRKKM